MMDYIRKYINTQSINDYEKADIILNIFFTGINFLLIVITVALFSSEKQEITDLSYQLIGIYFVNIIVRLYHIYMLQKDISNFMLKELISCIISVDQFYLILSLYVQIAKLLKIKEKINIVFPCFLYVLVFFSYDKLITYSPITFNSYLLSFGSLILLTQYMFSVIYVYYIYDLLKPGIDAIISTIISGGKNLSTLQKFIIGAPFSCLVLFVLHYLIKVWLLFFKSPLMLLYGNIVINIFKNGGIYFTFICCEIIVFALNKQQTQENEKKNDSDEVQIINL
jgi:hypothetical protein